MQGKTAARFSCHKLPTRTEPETRKQESRCNEYPPPLCNPSCNPLTQYPGAPIVKCPRYVKGYLIGVTPRCWGSDSNGQIFMPGNGARKLGWSLETSSILLLADWQAACPTIDREVRVTAAWGPAAAVPPGPASWPARDCSNHDVRAFTRWDGMSWEQTGGQKESDMPAWSRDRSIEAHDDRKLTWCGWMRTKGPASHPSVSSSAYPTDQSELVCFQ
eukprot:766932-Hanusia_phi.AAC.8